MPKKSQRPRKKRRNTRLKSLRKRKLKNQLRLKRKREISAKRRMLRKCKTLILVMVTLHKIE